jgi:L-idonate 5-dehydrogenase
VLHGRQDLRVEEQAEPEVGPGQVRVRFGAGGICGSDLHYFHEGRNGDFVVREPLVLGHEVAGTVVETGPGVAGLTVGATVAVNPTLPCRRCTYCYAGRENLCRDVFFFGSASRFPHVQGALKEYLVVPASQCVAVAPGTSVEQAAFAEPLAVALHSVALAGSLLGKTVVIVGAGPIGCLVLLAARRAGAARILVTDLAAPALAMAERLGADHAVNVATDPEGLARFAVDGGVAETVFECSGSSKGLAACIEAVKPGGDVVVVGMLPKGEVGVAINRVGVKEAVLRGVFRFAGEFAWAVRYIDQGLIDVMPLLTHRMPMADASAAFHLAADRSRSMKVQITAA